MAEPSAKENCIEDCEVLLGNSNNRFSGVTSTMLQTLEYQKREMNIRVLGAHNLNDTSLAITFKDAALRLRIPLKSGKYRVFHARRNNEMLQALILKHVFGVKLHIVFTSTAQRHHSRFTKWLMSKMDKVISTCNAAANYLDMPPANIIPHGIQTTTYTPRSHTNNPCVRIGIFGRVRAQKGVHVLVDACIQVLPQLDNCEAIIVGAIKEEDKRFVDTQKVKINNANLNDRIQFLGEQDFADIPGLFRSCDIVTALSMNEGFGLTVLEAMSSSCAVIATTAGAWPDIIREGVDGYIVPVDDVDAVAQRIQTLVTEPDLRTSMGKSGRAHIESNYTIEKEASALCQIYRSMQD